MLEFRPAASVEDLAEIAALESQNDIDNAPMRAVNRRLGYEPQPDQVEFRGPLRTPAGSPAAVAMP